MLSQHRAIRRHPDRPHTPIIDRIAYSFGMLAPLFTFPQIIDVWNGDTGGVSLLTWIAYLSFSAFWLVYSVYHKDRPLIILHALWTLMQLMVVIGVLIA